MLRLLLNKTSLIMNNKIIIKLENKVNLKYMLSLQMFNNIPIMEDINKDKIHK